jgi:hypothetical protein
MVVTTHTIVSVVIDVQYHGFIMVEPYIEFRAFKTGSFDCSFGMLFA